MNKLLEIKDLSHEFDGKTALNHVSFDVYDGEFLERESTKNKQTV